MHFFVVFKKLRVILQQYGQIFAPAMSIVYSHVAYAEVKATEEQLPRK